MKTVGITPPAQGQVRCERRADDTLLVQLVGHWTTRAGAPVVTEVYQQFDASPPVRRLAFEAQELTGWDGRLLTFLRQVIEASTQRQNRPWVSRVVTGIVWIIASDGLFAVLTERLGL